MHAAEILRKIFLCFLHHKHQPQKFAWGFDEYSSRTSVFKTSSGFKSQQAVSYLNKKPKLCIHLEPIFEFYNQGNSFDQLGILSCKDGCMFP